MYQVSCIRCQVPSAEYQYFTKDDPRPVRGSPGDGLLIVFVNY